MIERIFTRAPASDVQLDHRQVEVVAGTGIVGDRYFGAHDEPGQNVTFIEAEEIERFAATHGRMVDHAATGRNIVTRGVRLDALVGQCFTVGDVRFRGVETCEPCMGLGQALATADLTAADVVRHWVRRGGLRADVLTSGELVVGDVFAVFA
jgi:MOSC domain-containing protein YiiM